MCFDEKPQKCSSKLEIKKKDEYNFFMQKININIKQKMFNIFEKESKITTKMLNKYFISTLLKI